MGMPAILEVTDSNASAEAFESVWMLLERFDNRFSTYKEGSEISKINRKDISTEEFSSEMKEMFFRAEEWFAKTNGYFSVTTPEGSIDPSGLVKGWALLEAAQLLDSFGFQNYYLEIAGDIQTKGKNSDGVSWSIGIKNPFVENEIVKVVYPEGAGIATSGTAARGAHIYDPHTGKPVATYKSISVLGPDIYEADCMATAAFAMGENGMAFVEGTPGFEAYAIGSDGIAHMTTGFESYTTPL
jgi:thiamine biosynthesis lipoprotein